MKARKKLNAMLPLKFKLDRKSLEIMYRSFVLPSMEYANVLWGGTYDCDIAKLENIQIDALRLITGATARSNIANLYDEISIHPFEERIKCSSLNMMYKIVNKTAPAYLCHILPQQDECRPYNLRPKEAIKEPFCRLEILKRSFLPRTIKLWNQLPLHIQASDSLTSFKNYFKPESPERLTLYYYGERWPSVHHARMRIGCSKLNFDLCNNLHVIENSICTCGFPNETSQHFLFDCPNYPNQRITLFDSINNITCISLDILLFGNPDISLELNKRVFAAVHAFIIDSHRFD